MRCNMCVWGVFFALLFSLEFFFLCRLFIAYESLQCREETRNSAWRKEGWDVNVYYTGKKEMLDPDDFVRALYLADYFYLQLYSAKLRLVDHRTLLIIKMPPNNFLLKCLMWSVYWI